MVPDHLSSGSMPILVCAGRRQLSHVQWRNLLSQENWMTILASAPKTSKTLTYAPDLGRLPVPVTASSRERGACISYPTVKLGRPPCPSPSPDPARLPQPTRRGTGRDGHCERGPLAWPWARPFALPTISMPLLRRNVGRIRGADYTSNRTVRVKVLDFDQFGGRRGARTPGLLRVKQTL